MLEVDFDCFEIRESNGDGRSSTHIAYADTQLLAKDIADINSHWRRVYPYKGMYKICQTMDDFKNLQNTALRKSAMAKLSLAEQGALGLL